MNKVLMGILAGAAALVIGSAGAESYTGVCATNGGQLNIRKHNWVGAEKIGYLCDGWSVEVESVTDNGWAYVSATEYGHGFCSIEYLTCKPGGDGVWCNVSGGRVRIRSTMGGNTVGWLKPGMSVVVISWAKDQNGSEWAYTKQGWILGQNLAR